MLHSCLRESTQSFGDIAIWKASLTILSRVHPFPKHSESDCPSALRHSAIIFCTRTQGHCNEHGMGEGIMGRTVASERAFLISSVVGGVIRNHFAAGRLLFSNLYGSFAMRGGWGSPRPPGHDALGCLESVAILWGHTR